VGSIDRQPNGRWRARYRGPDGRQRSQTFDRKYDAERFLERNATDIQRGEWTDPARRRTLFAEWADAWWETTIKLRPATRRGYWQILHNHVLPHFGNRSLAGIDFMDVELFIAAKLREGKIGPKKIRDCVSLISLVIQGAIKAGVRRDNPAAGHRITVRRRKIRQGDVLTMDQAHALVEHVRDPYKPAVWLLVLTGIRPAELCGLRVRSVNFERNTVNITETLLPVSAYGDQRLTMVEGPTKTEAGDRTIPIPAWLATQLSQEVARRASRKGSPIDPDEPLFVNRVGKPLNRDKFRETVIRPALEAAGLPTDIRTYDLRHGHASMLIDLGANVLAVSQRMGHSDPAVTLREYGHLFAGVQEQLSEQLDDLRHRTTPATGSEPTDVTAGQPSQASEDTARTQQDTKSGSTRGKTGQRRTRRKGS